jgi:two-component system, LytTR family, response regulator
VYSYGKTLFFNPVMDKINIPTSKGIKVTSVQEIVRIQASSNYSIIYFRNEHPLLVARVLHRFEEILPPGIFQRIHRAHLINSYFITGVCTGNKLQLSNGELLPVSRRKRGVLYHFEKCPCR